MLAVPGCYFAKVIFLAVKWDPEEKFGIILKSLNQAGCYRITASEQPANSERLWLFWQKQPAQSLRYFPVM
ncbi:hypothetical protein [Sphingomonas alpina]|uniref:hypothetical protein n=1 Tax=Sphingomonas alpina TaxID=653931 RepID=UPI001E48386F|nr:hypothetical protein [Sphingomonas alpina]